MPQGPYGNLDVVTVLHCAAGAGVRLTRSTDQPLADLLVFYDTAELIRDERRRALQV